jgi:hypothetical protein
MGTFFWNSVWDMDNDGAKINFPAICSSSNPRLTGLVLENETLQMNPGLLMTPLLQELKHHS